jgi:hypothetical protein
MLGQLERYFRQMISDKDSYVASAGALEEDAGRLWRWRCCVESALQ